MTTNPALCTHELTPDTWHSTDKLKEDAATAVCRRCPLLLACQQYALTIPEPAGTWGGLTARQRARVLNPNDEAWLDKKGRLRRACGTYAALTMHIRFDETCETCETAQAARTEANRRAQLTIEHKAEAGGTPRGAGIHRRLGEEPCPACRAALATNRGTRQQAQAAA